MADSQEDGGSRLGRLVAGAKSEGASAAPAGAEIELLCFRIQDQLYALPSSCVRTILAPERSTELPLAPAHVRGVMSVLGRIVAILDFAVLEGREPTRDAKRLILVEASGLDAVIPVNEVSGIISLLTARIEPPPPHGRRMAYLTGQFVERDRVHFVLDAGALLASARLGSPPMEPA